jgi:hypothetical protein
MSFSLHVLTLGKRDKIEIPDYKEFFVIDESQEYDMRYDDIYTFMTMQEGQWFSISKEPSDSKDAYMAAFNLCGIDENVARHEVLPYWVDNEYTLGNLLPLVIKEDVISEFEHLLRYMLGQSPLSKIMFLARLQGTYEEIVCGTIKIDKFLAMIKEKSVLFNVCYIISKESTIPEDKYDWDRYRWLRS